MRDFPIHTALSILTLGAALFVWHPPGDAQWRALTDFTPQLTPLTPFSHRTEGALHAFIVSPVPTSRKLPPGKSAPEGPLFDDSKGVLDTFYRALRRTRDGEAGAITRIVHYGDSPTTADLITGDIRKQLQSRFGNAGHGFIFPAKPWAWYQHSGVSLDGSGWDMFPASRFEARDGLFGLGGVSFTGGPGAETKIDFGKAAYSRFEVWFLRQPGGGSLTLSSGGSVLGRIETAGGTKAPGFAAFESAPASTLSMHVTAGRVRLFGITAENAGPGVVYDSLGLNGASITVLSRMFNQQHWTGELQYRQPDLVIVNYGTNEADFPDFVGTTYEKELRETIRRLRAALPETSLLIMSPMDRGHKTASGEIETMPTIPLIVATQRRVARETGCAFFDTLHAMGGEGTMAEWYAAQPRLVSADFIHPNPAGGKMIATIFTGNIFSGLNRYQLRETR